MLVVREPGAAKNDLMAAALILAAIAILVKAWNRSVASAAPRAGNADGAKRSLPVGWPLAAAGLAVGLAAGTKVTALAMAAALSVAVLVLAPAGQAVGGGRRGGSCRRLLAGGYWYLRNLVVAGNPLPAVESLGPISLPHPERLQIGRPDFSIAHYATDTGVWRHYFAPGPARRLRGALAAGRRRRARGGAAGPAAGAATGSCAAVGAVALFGFLAYLFTPLSAAGADGAPEAFGINLRYVYGAVLAGLALVPLPRFFDERQPPVVAAGRAAGRAPAQRPRRRRPPRSRAGPSPWRWSSLAVLDPGGAAAGPRRAAPAAASSSAASPPWPWPWSRSATRCSATTSTSASATRSPAKASRACTSTPPTAGRAGIEDARIGLAGTTAGFAQYGFYGTDLSNRVVYLGEEGPHGAFNAIPTCAAFRAAVNAADLDYLVTAPFLNFLHPGDPIPSPEARWLRGEGAVDPGPAQRPGDRLEGPRRRSTPPPAAPRNAPLREIPDTPAR